MDDDGRMRAWEWAAWTLAFTIALILVAAIVQSLMDAQTWSYEQPPPTKCHTVPARGAIGTACQP